MVHCNSASDPASESSKAMCGKTTSVRMTLGLAERRAGFSLHLRNARVSVTTREPRWMEPRRCQCRLENAAASLRLHTVATAVARAGDVVRCPHRWSEVEAAISLASHRSPPTHELHYDHGGRRRSLLALRMPEDEYFVATISIASTVCAGCVPNEVNKLQCCVCHDRSVCQLHVCHTGILQSP